LFKTFTIAVYRDELQSEAGAHVLKHKNVVTMLAMVFELKHYGLVMEFVSQGSLDKFFRQHKVFSTAYNVLYLCVHLTVVVTHMC